LRLERACSPRGTRLHELRLRRELPGVELLSGTSGRASVGAYGPPHAVLLPWELALSGRERLSLADRTSLLRCLLRFGV
jgi:hypothetical protein